MLPMLFVFFSRFVSDHVNVVCKIIQTPSVVDINIGICDGTSICDMRRLPHRR